MKHLSQRIDIIGTAEIVLISTSLTDGRRHYFFEISMRFTVSDCSNYTPVFPCQIPLFCNFVTSIITEFALPKRFRLFIINSDFPNVSTLSIIKALTSFAQFRC